MKYFRPLKTQRWFSRTTAALAVLTTGHRVHAARGSGFSEVPAPQTMPDGLFGFSYEGVLGTSLDVRLGARSLRDSREGERQILFEIDRLEKILSTYCPGSEINRVKAGAPVESRELSDVLEAYDLWSARSNGALSPNLAEVISQWKRAAKTNHLPDPAALQAASATPLALNLDALGKGFIVDQAVAVARQFAPSGLVNLGGDLRAWGKTAWMIGIADPCNPADNAAPLVQFPLREAAVATSAGYARYYEIGGRRYSHLIDPRSLWPIDSGTSATIVARDCLTANALSTSVAVLGGASGANLARTYALDHLIVQEPALGGDGVVASPALERAPVANALSAPIATGVLWPDDFQVTVTVALKSLEGNRSRRPYVAVWIESDDQKLVRTLTIWGRQERYLSELTKWWSAAQGDYSVLRAVSRATRLPGVYTLAWDGRDDHGNPLPLGEYKIWIEINREHGHHVYESASLTCGLTPGAAQFRATAESDAAPVAYGPKHKSLGP
jgi:thiamine biosynthesis lipoprotein